MNGALALASSLAAMDRDALSRLTEKRSIASPASVHDPLGLALELLRPDSIARALQSLHRDSLRALLLADGGQVSNGDGQGSRDSAEDRRELQLLADSGLLGIDPRSGDFVALPEVAHALDGLRLPGQRDESPAERRSVDTSSWYGPALTSVRRGAELLRAIARRPVALGRKGQPTALALRGLAERVHSDQTEVERLLETMHRGGLLAEVPGHGPSRELGLSRHAPAWLELDYPARWVAIAETAMARIDDRLRQGLEASGHDMPAALRQLPHDFPLLPAARVESLARAAQSLEDLGLTVDGRLTPIAVDLLRGDIAAALAQASRAIPAPVNGVYLQPDLSLIVPGPLHPADEAALSAIAETEQLGPAASMRLSPASLQRAARGGIAPDQIRGLLERLSLTGIPQPLDYLLDDLSRALETQGRTPGQGPGGAERSLEGAHPTHDAEHDLGTQAPGLDDELASMVERVHAAARQSDGDGDLTRTLELAIRHRSPVQVTAVAGPDERVFTLLPVSLKGGRLRATDQKAGVERTIPVSAITAVEAGPGH